MRGSLLLALSHGWSGQKRKMNVNSLVKDSLGRLNLFSLSLSLSLIHLICFPLTTLLGEFSPREKT